MEYGPCQASVAPRIRDANGLAGPGRLSQTAPTDAVSLSSRLSRWTARNPHCRARQEEKPASRSGAPVRRRRKFSQGVAGAVVRVSGVGLEKFAARCRRASLTECRQRHNAGAAQATLLATRQRPSPPPPRAAAPLQAAMSCTEVQQPAATSCTARQSALFLSPYRPWMTLLNVRLKHGAAQKEKEVRHTACCC